MITFVGTAHLNRLSLLLGLPIGSIANAIFISRFDHFITILNHVDEISSSFVLLARHSSKLYVERVMHQFGKS